MKPSEFRRWNFLRQLERQLTPREIKELKKLDILFKQEDERTAKRLMTPILKKMNDLETHLRMLEKRQKFN